MKTLVTINVGLTTKEATRLDIHRALDAVAACGVSVTVSAVVNGEWEGKPEPCLFIQGFVSDPHAPLFRARLALASQVLSQHCLALYCDGKGELIGCDPSWQFDESLFHFHPEGNTREIAAPPQSECQRIQAETAERLLSKTRETEGDKDGTPVCSDASPVDGWTRESFSTYLSGTLIPDLERDGFTATAEDFETALAFIRR